MSLEPQSKDGTNSSNLWMCFQVTMGSNNIANILQRHYSAFRILSHSCNENFLLYIFMLKSVRRPLGVWDKVWRTQTQFTLFLFITLLFFPAQRYSCWISSVIFLPYRFEAENVLVLFLNFLNVVSILACIGSPFIELLLYQPSSGLHMLLNLRSNHNII